EGRLYDQALDVVARDYYRPVDRKALLNTSVDAAVKSLHDRFSNYFDPQDYKSFQEATNGAFEGVGMNVEEVAQGLRVITVFDGTIVSTDGRARPKHVFKATGGAIDPKIPVAVLVNRGSASASEIVTGALQDRHRADVVGTRTFGKGVFQEIEELPNGGALDITVGQYFLPSGRNIGGAGVDPGAGIKPDIRASD